MITKVFTNMQKYFVLEMTLQNGLKTGITLMMLIGIYIFD